MFDRFFPRCLGFFSFFTALVPAIAGTIPPSGGCTVPEGFLQARLDSWQKRLKLENWKISIIVSRTGDLRPKTLGNIHWDADHMTAVIRVLDPADYRLACPAMLEDMEVTVVHELVHLELSSLPRPQASRHEEEYAVSRISDALLKLDREKQVTLAAGTGEGPRTGTADRKPSGPPPAGAAPMPSW